MPKQCSRIHQQFGEAESFHLNAPVEPSLKSSSVGNAAPDVGCGAPDSADSWSTNSVSMSIVTRFCRSCYLERERKQYIYIFGFD